MFAVNEIIFGGNEHKVGKVTQYNSFNTPTTVSSVGLKKRPGLSGTSAIN